MKSGHGPKFKMAAILIFWGKILLPLLPKKKVLTRYIYCCTWYEL